MANVCPYCAAPADLTGEPVDAAGRLLRCTRCGTKWLPRFTAADQFRPREDNRPLAKARRTGGSRFERVIEHVEPDRSWEARARAAKPSDFREQAGQSDARRDLSNGRWTIQAWSGVAAAIILSLLVATLAVNYSIVGGGSGDAMTQYSGLEIRLVRGVVERARAGLAVVVEGEISNITDQEIAVPAVRVSLRSEGVERYSWFVEPTETRLAGGSAVLFRSVHPAPSSGIDEVAFRLTERSKTVIGMR